MNLPVLINQLYGEFQLTGLYSFEFQNNGKKITEIFFMMPPTDKSLDESTRSTTQPTLSSNYNTDAGNATKPLNLKGTLYFPIVGSPSNPIASDASNLPNPIDGMTEFFKLRWMLVRYRDYTMTKNAKLDVPTLAMGVSPEIAALYKKVSSLMKSKQGALLDQIQLVFHDYDMDDHYFCRISKFSSSQSASKYLAIEYNIMAELYEKYTAQTAKPVQIKKTVNQEMDVANALLQSTDFSILYPTITLPVGSV